VKTLTINIPTFNRNAFCIDCISSLINSYKKLKEEKNIDISDCISINIFDNNNDRNLEFLLKYHFSSLTFIKYIYNNGNIGSQKNIKQCYLESVSDYVYVLGDDDKVEIIFFEYIYKILNSSNYYPLIYLNSYGYDNNKLKAPYSIFKKYEIDSLRLIDKLNIKLTFISSIILHKNEINKLESSLV